MDALYSSRHRLAYVLSGTGEPVLLIHGIYGTGFIFDSLRSALDQQFKVVAPDTRGHGGSDRIDGPMDSDAVVADLLAMLDELDLPSVHVIGYSHGGGTAQVLAQTAPHRVRSLVLVATYAQQSLTRRERILGKLAPTIVRFVRTHVIVAAIRISRSSLHGRSLTAEQAHAYSVQVGRNRAGRMAAALKAAKLFDSREWLPSLTMPTMVIHGLADVVVSPRQRVLLKEGIPHARLHTIPDGGHLLLITHEREIRETVGRWLEEQEGRSAGVPESL